MTIDLWMFGDLQPTVLHIPENVNTFRNDLRAYRIRWRAWRLRKDLILDCSGYKGQSRERSIGSAFEHLTGLMVGDTSRRSPYSVTNLCVGKTIRPDQIPSWYASYLKALESGW